MPGELSVLVNGNIRFAQQRSSIQMEAVKHTEDHFPHDISPIEVYDSISLSFLRGISSEKGLKELEKFLPLFSNFKYSAQLFENE